MSQRVHRWQGAIAGTLVLVTLGLLYAEPSLFAQRSSHWLTWSSETSPDCHRRRQSNSNGRSNRRIRHRETTYSSLQRYGMGDVALTITTHRRRSGRLVVVDSSPRAALPYGPVTNTPSPTTLSPNVVTISSMTPSFDCECSAPPRCRRRSSLPMARRHCRVHEP